MHRMIDAGREATLNGNIKFPLSRLLYTSFHYKSFQIEPLLDKLFLIARNTEI